MTENANQGLEGIQRYVVVAADNALIKLNVAGVPFEANEQFQALHRLVYQLIKRPRNEEYEIDHQSVVGIANAVMALAVMVPRSYYQDGLCNAMSATIQSDEVTNDLMMLLFAYNEAYLCLQSADMWAQNYINIMVPGGSA